MEKSKRKGLKMPTTYTLLFFIIIVVALLTWVVPGGEYQLTDDGTPIAGTYTQWTPEDHSPQGLWEVLNAPVQGFFAGTNVAFFVIVIVIVIGGFLGVVMKTGAVDAGIAKIKTVVNTY